MRLLVFLRGDKQEANDKGIAKIEFSSCASLSILVFCKLGADGRWI